MNRFTEQTHFSFQPKQMKPFDPIQDEAACPPSPRLAGVRNRTVKNTSALDRK
jgi:hypothetical protein